jgi:thioredoxin 1
VDDLDLGTFDRAIGSEPVIVDFWAPWCRPCKALEPILEQLTDRVEVARLNIDEYPEIAGRYEILSIPTVMLFSNGEPRGTVVGLRPLTYFEEWLAEVLPAREFDGLAAQGHGDT